MFRLFRHKNSKPINRYISQIKDAVPKLISLLNDSISEIDAMLAEPETSPPEPTSSIDPPQPPAIPNSDSETSGPASPTLLNSADPDSTLTIQYHPPLDLAKARVYASNAQLHLKLTNKHPPKPTLNLIKYLSSTNQQSFSSTITQCLETLQSNKDPQMQPVYLQELKNILVYLAVRLQEI